MGTVFLFPEHDGGKAGGIVRWRVVDVVTTDQPGKWKERVELQRKLGQLMYVSVCVCVCVCTRCARRRMPRAVYIGMGFTRSDAHYVIIIT